MSKVLKELTMEEVSKHNTEADCWIVIDSIVYDVTKFLKAHPGGKAPLIAFAGKDATSVFFDLHKKNVLFKYGPKLQIGTIGKPLLALDAYSPDSPTPNTDTVTPFAEHTSVRGWASPFFTQTHLKFREATRKFYDVSVRADVESLEESGDDPSRDMYLQMGKSGVLASRIGVAAVPYIESLGIALPAGLNPKQFDYFHEQIAHEEVANLGVPGYADGLATGLVIGLPPIIHFGSQMLKDKAIKPCLLGEKIICLAISEPQAGSDVAGLVTHGKLDTEGTHYIINGQKKWITNGSFSHYFVTAVRTGPKGHNGISLIFIERGQGVTTSKIRTSYSPAAGTATVFFDNAIVPKQNIIGEVNQGFKYIMANFNHERWLIAVIALQYVRMATADSYKWAMQRKVFGKRLIDQPVIRFKLAQMTAGVESCQAWLDSITYQMNTMSYDKQTKELGGPIALLKFYITRTAQMVSDNATQVFGGRAITRTGMGQFVERNARSYKFPAIYGGSEEILADLAVRQSMRNTEDAIKAQPKLAYVAKL